VDDRTSRRRWSALLALALGAVAIGLTEFVPAGLLPSSAAASPAGVSV
jgi:DHA1 family inner membrane transport protein